MKLDLDKLVRSASHPSESDVIAILLGMRDRDTPARRRIFVSVKPLRVYSGQENQHVEGDLIAEPYYRERLDHYVGRNYHPGPDDDPEGWDEEGWQQEYVGPLVRKVTAALDHHFGPGLFWIDVGEKGHVYIGRKPSDASRG
jgi:hypothetical protein